MSDNRKLTDFLLSTQLFKGASVQLVAAAVESVGESIVIYESGSTICTHDSFERRLGCIVDGEISVRKSGSSLEIRSLGSGEVFGAECIYSPRPYYPVEIVSTEKSKVFFLDKAAVYRLMMLDPAFSSNFIALLSDTIYYLYNCVSIYTGGSAENRLAAYLLENFAGYKTLTLKQSYSSLAVTLDIGRASLYRAFDSLTQAGAIEKEGRYIRLLNESVLKSFA